MIRTKNIALFKKSIDSLSSLIEEANVRFKDTGIFIKAIDKTQILLVDFSISKSFFDSYKLEPNLLALNIQELGNIISRSFPNDKLYIDIKEDYFKILLKGKIERDFHIPYIDLSDQELKLPDIKYKIDVNINAGLLKEIIKDVNLIASTLIFKVDDGKFYIEAEGEKGKIKTLLPQIRAGKENVSVKYSLSFLRNIFKNIDPESIVNLKFSEDSPLYIHYKINENINIKFYLSSMLF
jgi:proliferating cell nuclear antigen PCNA